MAAIISFLAEKTDQLLGLSLSPGELGWMQMTVRAVIVFTFGVLIVRLGDRRLLGKNAGFDMLLVVILGSVLSRAVNGDAAFFPTLGVSAVLVFMHHLVARLACKSHWFSRFIKGQPYVVVSNGELVPKALAEANVTRDDLDENLRLNGGVADLAKVREARLERNGTISVVQK